jgi:ribose 1,5-bisphosphokinase
MSGRLIVVVGASGAGKDSLLAYARQNLPCGDPVRFVRRYITRPSHAGHEDHFALQECEFRDWLEHSRFALSWESHGLWYGIGHEIDAWLEADLTVVLNGSRSHLAEALASYPYLEVVHITASAAKLADRLQQRGRENAADRAARLAKAEPAWPPSLSVTSISNDADLASAGQALLAYIHQHPAALLSAGITSASDQASNAMLPSNASKMPG